MKKRQTTVLLFVLLLWAPLAFSDWAILFPEQKNRSEVIADLKAEEARFLFVNPHDGEILVDLKEESLKRLSQAPRLSAYQGVTELPTSQPGSTLRVLIYGTDFSVVDSLVQDVNLLGGIEVWRGRALPTVQVDLPIVQLRQLEGNPKISSFHFDQAGQPSLSSSIPLIGVTGQYDSFYWPASWGPFYYLAVLDSGVTGSGAFASRVDHQVDGCFSTGGLGGWQSLCPDELSDGDPYVEVAPDAAVPCNLSFVDCLHGSKVAAIAASDIYPHFGVAATSNVMIAAMQVWSYKPPSSTFPNGAVRILRSDVQKALDYLLQFGILGWRVSAVNMSFTYLAALGDDSCGNDALAPYVKGLRNFGIFSVAAAGNVLSSRQDEGVDPNYYHRTGAPACIPSVIAVGASTDTYPDEVAVNEVTGSGSYFSSYSSSQIDFWAPGSNISTPFWGVDFGTSFAAPHVAGVLTRVRGRYPSDSADDIENKVKSACPMLTDSRSPYVSKPRICWKSAWQ